MTTLKAIIILSWLGVGFVSICVGSYLLGGAGGLLLAFGIYTIFGISYDAFMREQRT